MSRAKIDNKLYMMAESLSNMADALQVETLADTRIPIGIWKQIRVIAKEASSLHSYIDYLEDYGLQQEYIDYSTRRLLGLSEGVR